MIPVHLHPNAPLLQSLAARWLLFQPVLTFCALSALTLALMDALYLKSYDSVLFYFSGSLFLL